MGFLLDPHGFNPSPFEARIAAEGPIFHARFRDGDFTSVIADSSGNNRNLVKQIAAATRSDVKTRTTHPGGALFPSVTYGNWGTQGTFYKRAAESLLSGATEYTALISFRMIKAPAGVPAKMFALGTENVGDTGSNDLVVLRANNNAPTGPHWWKHRESDGGLVQVAFGVTEKIEDGVNRLAIVRYTSGTIHRLTTSKPGHEMLTEASFVRTDALDTLSRALILNARTETGTGSSTTLEMVVDQIALFDTDIGATAEADLHSKWMDEVAGAGYYPSMMQFDGSTGNYSATYTSSGSKVTGVCRFNRASFTGGGVETLMRALGPTGDNRLVVYALASDFSDADRQDCLQVEAHNSSGVKICQLVSPAGYLDGEDHVLLFAFDGVAGTAVFRIDEDDADDTGSADRIAPTTGTLESGASSTFVVGASSAAAALPYGGKEGFVGHADAYLTNYEDFMDGNLPKPIDEKNWTEFGSSQPLVFAHDGDLENNKGSAGDFTKNGTITRTTGGSP